MNKLRIAFANRLFHCSLREASLGPIAAKIKECDIDITNVALLDGRDIVPEGKVSNSSCGLSVD